MRSLLFFMAAVLCLQSQAQASCELSTPGHLTKIEKAQLEAKGYIVKNDRHLYQHSRFLNVYEYYEMKHPEQLAPGTKYLTAVLAPYVTADSVQYNQNADVGLVNKREFRFMVAKPKFQATVEFANSVPPRLAHDKVELENADFSSMPVCR